MAAEPLAAATPPLADRVPQYLRELEHLIRTYHARLQLEIMEPMLQDVRALELDMQRDFLDSLAIDNSPETVDWYAQNLRTLIKLRTILALPAVDGGPPPNSPFTSSKQP